MSDHIWQGSSCVAVFPELGFKGKPLAERPFLFYPFVMGYTAEGARGATFFAARVKRELRLTTP